MPTVDLEILNANVLNVFSRQFEKNSLWINHGKIVATGNRKDLDAKQVNDIHGKYVVPGFIDAHVHIESSLLVPSEFAKVVLPKGTTSVFIDPHEIANVIGIDGIKYMIKDSRQTPLDVFTMLPSSVPCAPFEHNGATLLAKDLKPLYKEPEVKGLAEVMDYPAVLKHDPQIMDKIHDAIQLDYQVDGHGAGLNRSQLDIYRQAHINTDHECTTQQQIKDRLNEGFYVYLREGTVERDLANTVAVVNEGNAQRFALCTDDKYVNTILSEGSINACIKLAIKHGIRPETAYTMASYNAAKSHHVDHLGALSTGFNADLVIVNDPYKVDVKRVMKNGHWISNDDFKTKPLEFNRNTMHHHVQKKDLELKLTGAHPKCHVIDVHPNHIDTGNLVLPVNSKDSKFVADTKKDILKIVVCERHHNLGTVGVGLVHGFKLKQGAVAGTIAHDSHNIIAVGTNDDAIYRAIEELTRVGGGISVVDNQKVLATMPLPVAGLMSNQPWQIASKQLTKISNAYDQISHDINFNPFITLSFLALPVIPTIKITDQGLYDFDQQKFINVQAK
ncbi:adenine deaminase [Philodulcilactobacillus myokoensis]|uniref:Adenine deaminase n=1 Tax=Philodulcilactobacillus myokoensis TaxID=2929573 RepID=A0A9W6ESS2_9LACO|nr:adenine deaminase [Philodulcilactobacillus myokoensis]GLB46434.1 adenine deaminase [Philodulcilactobacillus myokoensis]